MAYSDIGPQLRNCTQPEFTNYAEIDIDPDLKNHLPPDSTLFS
jgi:hypothetical protein